MKEAATERLDPLFVSLLKHHWLEESQHAKLDTLVVDKLARELDAPRIEQGVDDYMDIGKLLDGGLVAQVDLDLESLEKAIGRTLSAEDVVWTFNRLKQSPDFKALFEPFEGARAVDDLIVDLVTKGPYPLAASAGGKTLGILGLGRIGEAIAKRALACGMKIRYHNRRKKDAPFPYDPDRVTLAKNSDVLIVVTPGGAETQRIINAEVLDALGPQGYLVNIARGSVVDEPVLLRYLQEKKIAGAGLDVFADEPRVPPEFFKLDNAVLLPHVGSATMETRTAMGNLQVDNLLAHFSGQPVLTRVV